jgi:hypothetical protein
MRSTTLRSWFILCLLTWGCQQSENSIGPIDGTLSSPNPPGISGFEQCRIDSFSVSPASGFVGERYNFEWQTSGCDQVSLQPKGGDGLPANGDVLQPVYYSDWFTLTASGASNQTSATRWVQTSWSGGSTWSSEFANAQNNCRSPYPGPVSGTLAWTSDFSSTIGPMIIATDASVLVKAGTDVRCVSPAGREKWIYHTSAESYDYFHMLVGYDGTIYLNDGGSYYSDYQITALRDDGTVRWQSMLNQAYYNTYNGTLMSISPDLLGVWLGHTAGCSSYPSRLFLFSPEGTLLNTIADEQRYLDSSSYDGSDSIILMTDFDVISIDFQGDAQWSFSNRVSGGYLSIASPGWIYAPSRAYYPGWLGITILDNDGTLLRNMAGFTYLSMYRHPAACGASGCVYFVGSDTGGKTYLFAMNPLGDFAWQYEIPHGEESNSLVLDANENIFMATFGWNYYNYTYWYNGILRAVSPEGVLLWQYSLPLAPSRPFACLSMDQTLYVASGYTLYAFRDPVSSPVLPPLLPGN